MVEPGGLQDPAGGRGAWASEQPSAVPRLGLAGPPRGPRSVAGGRRPDPSGRLELRCRGARLEKAMGRAHARVPADGDRMMSDLIRLSGTTVNAPDAIALARFYADITGGAARGDEHWALVEGPNGDIGFQQIDDYRAPSWPGGEVPM